MPFDNVLTDEQEEKKRQETLASRLAQTDYSQMLKEQNIVRKDTVRGNMVATSGINPDQHARTLKVANEAGLEPSIVRKNPQKVESANRINSIDYDGIVNNAPALTSFLVDPKKAALIQDEVPFWQQVEEYWQDIEDAYGLGKQNLRTSEISFKRIESILIGGKGPTDEELKELDSMKYAGSPADDRNYLSGIPIVATENLPLFIERLKTGAEFGVKGGASGAVLGASAGAAAGSVVGGVGAIPGAAAGAAKGIRVGAVFGSKFGVAFEGFKQESGLALDEFLRFRDIDGNPIDKDVAATAALIVGIANASLEFVGDAAVLKQMPGLKKFIRFADKGEVKKLLVNQSFKDVLKSIGKRYAQVAATEGTTEALQEMITVAGGEISKALSDGEFDKVDSQEFFDRVAESFVKGTQGGIGLSTPGIGGQAIIDGRRISRAKKNAKNLSDRIDNILGSKLAGRSDIMLEELYQSVADSKGEGELHISAAPVLNQLQEAGQDPVQFFSDLGIDETQLFEAVSTGGDVVVKAGKVLSVAKDSDFKDLLLASVRKTPDAMTALEAEDYVGRVEKDAAAAVEKLNLEAEQVAQMESQANQVFDQVAEAIISGGAEAVPGQRFALAELYRANALRQMADWAAEGKEFDVVSFYESLGLQFKREGFQQPESIKNVTDVKLSGLLNELRSAKKDTFKKQENMAFGRSISERAREIGVKDDRGDLKGQDIDKDKKPFVRNLLRDDGVSLDELGLRLFEEGYFSERPLVSDLLDALTADAGAIDREGRIFSESAADPAAQERLTMLESLEEDLARSGLGIDELTNEQIIQALNAKEDVGESGLFQSADPVNSEAFKNWFGDSKVVDDNGDPLVVFHGTKEIFDAFDPERSIYGTFWFTNDRGIIERGESGAQGKGEILDIYLSIKNPAGWEEYDKLGIDQIISRGFDGLMLPDGDEITYVAFEPTQIKSVNNRGSFDANDPRILFQEDLEQTSEFTAWAGTDKPVIEPEEINDFDFTGDGPFVVKAFHGTTHEFDAFDATKGNAENQFGKVSYFTSSEQDAVDNYEGEGPDLTNRIEKRKEEIEDDLADLSREATSITNEKLVENGFFSTSVGILEELSSEKEGLLQEEIDAEFKKLVKDRYGYDGETNIAIFKLARNIARQELTGGQDRTLELYIKMEKPFVVGANEQWLEFVDNEGNDALAVARVADDEGIEVSEVENRRDEFEDQIDEARWDIDEEEDHALVDAINEVARRNDVDASQLAAEVYDLGPDAKADDIEQLMRSHDDFAYADGEQGELIGSQLIAEVIEELGFDSIVLKNADTRFASMNIEPGTAHVHVFDSGKTNIKSVENIGTFGPQDPRIKFQRQGKDKVRGGIRGTFGDFNSQFEIFVTPDMNLSTLLHESGHLFLEMLGREAALEDAPKRVKDNLQAALEWLEVDSFDQLESKHHEKWARSFEVYLREGKAPSARIQRAFDKFRAWLVDVYKRLAGMYDIEITPEIRGIFDTLLSSEQEVTQVEADNAFKVNQDISDLMVESEKEAYFKQAQRSHDEAVSETLKRQMRIQAREVKKWWNIQKKKVQAEISDEVWNEPKYQAWHFITKGTFYNADTPKELAGLRLNRQKLIDTFQTKGVLQDMPRTVPPMWQKEGGLHPDELAEFVGYSSGQEMIQDIINAERPKSRIERLTQEKMERDNPMPDISEDAIEATFNDQRALFLASELKALRTRVSRDEQFGIDVLGKAASSPLGIMKEAVRRVIDQSKVSDITKPFIYLNNSQRAARAAQQAIVDEDYQTATSEKAKQLFNFLMFRAALDVKEKSAKIKKRLQDVSRKKINPSIIATEYIKAMKDITTAVLNPEDPDSEGSLEAAVEWAKVQENDPDNPANLVIPAMFMKDFTNVDVKNMTFTELQAIDSMIKSLREEGRRRGDEVTAEFRERDLDLAERVLKNVNKKPRNVINKGPLVENAGDYFDSYVNGHVTASSFFEEMDGFEDMGPVWTSFKGLAADMRANEIKMSEEKLVDLRKIFNDHYSRVQLTKMAYQPVRLGDFGALSTITRQKLLALALNFGNEDNIQAVVNGYAVDRHALFRAIDEQLTKEDWQFVQKIWDHVDSYWPDVAALEKRFVGVVPEKVQAQAVETRHGTFKGGYYPLKYNSKLSIFANKKELDHRAALMGSGRTSRAMTEHGHTKERVGSGGMKVKLDLGVVFGHVNDVIHDLNFREGVWEMSKLLNGPSFSQAIEDTYGADVHANLSKWLKDIAGGPDEPLDAVGKALSWAKTGSTIVILGLSLATMAVQLLGVASTLTRLGTARTIKGLSKFYGNPRAGWKFVFENSPFMRNRFSNFDRDAQSFARSITNASISQEVALFAFKGIGFMDLMISMPTWLAAYQQGMDKFNNDAKKAAKHADNIVIGTQGSGEIQDLPAIMRGSIGTRLLTQFMSYFVAMGQLMRRNKIQLRKGDISPNTFALNMLYLVILPPIIDALMRGDEPDDDEGYAEWAAKKVGAYTVAPLVGVRSIASAVLDDYPFQLAPIQDQIKKGISGTSAVFNTGEDATDYQVKGAVTLFGVLTKTPTKKVYEQYDYWLKVLEGEEELTAQGLLFNKRKR